MDYHVYIDCKIDEKFFRVVNKNKETVFMAAAAHGNVQIFNMLTDLTGNLDSNCSIVKSE